MCFKKAIWRDYTKNKKIYFFFRNEPDELLNTLCNSFKVDKNVFFPFPRKTSNENFSRFILPFFHRSLLIASVFFFFSSKKKLERLLIISLIKILFSEAQSVAEHYL